MVGLDLAQSNSDFIQSRCQKDGGDDKDSDRDNGDKSDDLAYR